jgi:type VI secretion system protein VasJ
MRGTAPDQLACGILRQSCDAIGRPYPLLLMGSGNSQNWDESWENLPMACEALWNRADTLFSQEYRAISELVAGLGTLTGPEDIFLDDTLPPALSLKALNGDMDSEFSLFSLEAGNGSRIEVAAAMRLSLLLKKRNATPPVAVFIGGGETAHMAVMRRPLKSLDFEMLWNQQ